MIAHRRIEPEWLDTLPQGDADSMRSRRDLRRINAFMLNAAIMVRLLTRVTGGEPPGTVLDLGAGDGIFLLTLARRLAPAWRGVRVILVDRHNAVADQTCDAFKVLGWRADPQVTDVFDFLDRAPFGAADVVIANLFLHHFAQNDLRRLLRRIAHAAPIFAACEPRRDALSLVGARSVWMLGCNRITRHDAPASVRAGFRGRELSALWPTDSSDWELREAGGGPFTHCFAAVRRR